MFKYVQNKSLSIENSEYMIYYNVGRHVSERSRFVEKRGMFKVSKSYNLNLTIVKEAFIYYVFLRK